MTIAVWLGSAAPLRSIRWLDGALAAAATLARRDPPHARPSGRAIAIAAGAPAWLELAGERAGRAGIASVGVPTELELDYLGWAQIAAAAARHVAATTVIVDEASRPERWPEVAAIAELMDAAQLGGATALAADGVHLRAVRAAGQTVRIRGPAVIGVRIAGPDRGDDDDGSPGRSPRTAATRVDLAAIGVDPLALDHRAAAARAAAPRKTVDGVADHLAAYARARGPEVS